MSQINSSKLISVVAVVLALVYCCLAASGSSEAKLLRRSRYQDDYLGGYDMPYSGATGERAIVTVRGARNPYDGSAPSKIAIEDNPYRGAYPRGVYDRLDGYAGSRYPRADPYLGGGGGGGYGMGGFGGPYGGYGSG